MVLKLREQEAQVLTAIAELGESSTLKELIEKTNLDNAAVMRGVLSLSKDNLISIDEKPITILRLTKEGKTYSDIGLPERRINQALKRSDKGESLDQIAQAVGVSKDFATVVVGWLKKKDMAELEKVGDKLILRWKEPPQETHDEKLLNLLNEKESVIVETLDKDLTDAVQILDKRNLITKNRRIEYQFKIKDKGLKAVNGGIEILREVSQLTPSIITSGDWQKIDLRRYDVEAPVTFAWPGKRQPYNSFLDELKMKLISLGFTEMDGPLVELMFFNCDALFMPQDHPARDIHDVYFIQYPGYGSLKQYDNIVNNVKETHENGWKTGSSGWRYTFSKQESCRLILRSHGTAISARTLVKEDLEIPGKYFSIARCYRPEVTDRTHLTEFNQVEGIVVGEELTLKDLFGVLERFALDIAGADSVKFRPDYFPFTEPSVELLAYKEGNGWMEFGGAGIFRPELTLPLGITVPVLAWGLGVDRLYMMKSGVDDIRNLFTYDLNWLRKEEIL